MSDALDLVERILQDRDNYQIMRGIIRRAALSTKTSDVGQQNSSLTFDFEDYPGRFFFPGIAAIVTGQKVEAYIPKKGGKVLLLRAYGSGQLPTYYIAREYSIDIG